MARKRARKDDLTGQRFGRWTVLGEGTLSRHRGTVAAVWHCRCDCGREKTGVQHSNLLLGLSRSCGCLRAENARKVMVEANRIASRLRAEGLGSVSPS